MSRPSSLSLLGLREFALTAIPFLALALGLLWLVYLVLDPAPPRTLVLATGPEQSDFAEFGRRYARELARFGIRVTLRTTAGAAENRRLLRDPHSGVDAAFVQSGAGEALYPVDEDTSGRQLLSLGNLFLEPVWIFYRADAARRVAGDARLDRLPQLASLRMNVGAPGSGSDNLLAKLLDANDIHPARMSLQRLAPTPAVVALLEAEIDALALVSSPDSALVRMLLLTPHIRLFEFAQAEAYVRRFPFLRSVTLPRGTADLAADAPPADVRLIAATASLAATDSLHPALVQLLVQAARRIHGESSWFGPAGEFPNGTATEFPLSAEAERFYRGGPPLLQRYLPFWLANLIDRMWVALVSIVAILIPLSRVVPPLYALRIRSRVFRWYRQLREIESEAGEGFARGAPTAALAKRLDELERRVQQVRVPLSYADELYALRANIDLVRKRVHGGAPPGPGEVG